MKNNKKITKEEALKKIAELQDYIKRIDNTYERYDEIEIAGDTYFVLGYNKETDEVTYCMKDIMSKEDIEKYFTDKWYVDSYKDVRFNSDIRNNKYEDSYICKVLNGAFKEDKLKGLDVVGNVRLLTKEEVETLDTEHSQTDSNRYGFWTMTPYNDMDNLTSGSCARVFRVDSDGGLGAADVYNAYGVRPVITLSADTLD